MLPAAKVVVVLRCVFLIFQQELDVFFFNLGEVSSDVGMDRDVPALCVEEDPQGSVFE